MSSRGEVFERNVARLVRQAYRPERPSVEFRRELERTFLRTVANGAGTAAGMVDGVGPAPGRSVLPRIAAVAAALLALVCLGWLVGRWGDADGAAEEPASDPIALPLPRGDESRLPADPSPRSTEAPESGTGDARTALRAPEGEAAPPARSAALAGRVRDSAGEPVTRFRVALLPEQGPNEFHVPRTRDFEDPEGAFRWNAAPTGRQRVFVHAQGYALLDLGWHTLGAAASATELAARLSSGGEIRGHVVDGHTGNPVPDALVLSERDLPLEKILLRDADERLWLPASTRTSAGGAFVLRHLSEGEHTLRITAPGYAPLWVDPVRVAEGASVADLVLELASGGRLEGRVSRADGTPAAGAQLVAALGAREERPQTTIAVAVTDVEGRYAFAHLPPGFLVVVLPDERSGRPRVKPAEVRAGETVVVDFPAESDGALLFGVVTEAGGAPVAHQNIALYDLATDELDEGEAFRASATSADGSYAFEGVAPGRYLLYLVEDMGRRVRLLDGFEVPDWPEFQRDVRVLGAELSGQVTDGRSGAPFAGARVVVVLEDPENGASLFAGDAITDSAGRYSIGPLNPGSYTVLAYAEPRSGLGLELSGELSITETEPSATADLALGVGGSVVLVVTDEDEAPVSGALVTIRDAAGVELILREALLTDAAGRCESPGLPPGRYELEVRDERSRRRTTTVHCEAGTRRTVDFVLAAPSSEPTHDEPPYDEPPYDQPPHDQPPHDQPNRLEDPR